MINPKLLKRKERCVCKYCGGSLEVRLIIHNYYGGQGMDLYCPSCDKVENGIEPEIYEIAKAYVDKFEFNYYLDMEESAYNYRMNVAKIGTITKWVIEKFLSKRGNDSEYYLNDEE